MVIHRNLVMIEDIKPALTVVSVAFMEETTAEFVKTLGAVTRSEIHSFPRDDSDEEPYPVVVIQSFANGERLMFFSLENPIGGRLSLVIPVIPEVDITGDDILLTIKNYTDNIDANALHEQLIKEGKFRDNRDPREIN